MEQVTSSEPESTTGLRSIALPAAPTGCPPPLVWTEVLAQFRATAVTVTGGTEARPVTALTYGSGPPLYVLGGWSGAPELYCLTAWLLKDSMRCVLIDYPNWARSLDDLADAAVTIGDTLNDRSFALLGTAFGSAVATTCALKYPDRVQQLIVQSPIVSYRLSLLERGLGLLASVLMPAARRVPLRFRLLAANHALWFPPIDPTRFQFLAQSVFQTPLSQVARRFRMLHGLQLAPRLSEVRCPTLIVTGEGDPQRAKDASDVMAREIPNSTAEILSNCGQIPFLTHPHRLVNLIKPFALNS